MHYTFHVFKVKKAGLGLQSKQVLHTVLLFPKICFFFLILTLCNSNVMSTKIHIRQMYTRGGGIKAFLYTSKPEGFQFQSNKERKILWDGLYFKRVNWWLFTKQDINIWKGWGFNITGFLPDIEPLVPGDCFGCYQTLTHQRLQRSSLAALMIKL